MSNTVRPKAISLRTASRSRLAVSAAIVSSVLAPLGFLQATNRGVSAASSDRESTCGYQDWGLEFYFVKSAITAASSRGMSP